MHNQELLITPGQAEQIFTTAESVKPEVVNGEIVRTPFDVELEFGATTLGVEPVFTDDEANLKVTGNTVWRLCDAADECTVSVCGLGRVCMDNDDRRAQNCAAANAELAMNSEGMPGYVLTPTNHEVIFFGDAESYSSVTALDADGEQGVLYNKMKTASTVIISEHDIPDGQEGVRMAINGADSSLAVALTEIQGVRYALAMMPSRPNLGDRGPKDQILRKGIDAILDKHGLEGDAREQAIRELRVRVDLGYSADLENFAHRVTVPGLSIPDELQGHNLAALSAEDMKLLSGPSKYALTLMKKNGLIDPETGEITGELNPKMVMGDQYPGALENGEIYPELEVQLGIDAPYSEGGCPGDGQLCHVHYRKITDRTLRGQLLGMGVSPENIDYNDENAVDPAAPDNRLASNRRMQLAGVPVAKTPRSINGVGIKFLPR
jgi:hypothetical protein